MKVETGTVKFFNEEKGYGFILNETGKEIFVHATSVSYDGIKKGDHVSFTIGSNKKGEAAVDVALLN